MPDQDNDPDVVVIPPRSNELQDNEEKDEKSESENK